ncbi:MAG: hypothetical protein E7575_03005 [Ruminococcaceae bacterium]|nr:hypothetical protein [Oscillospiraceae bacterium]
MIIILFMIFFVVVLSAWNIATLYFIYSHTNALVCRGVLTGLSLGGAAGACITAAHFFLSVRAFDVNAEAVQVVVDNFRLYLSIECSFAAVGILVCLVSALLKNKMSAMVPVIMPLWSIVSLFWTFLMASLSGAEWINVSLYMTLFGCSIALLCMAPLLLAAFARVKYLSDEKLVAEALRIKREKRERMSEARAARKRLREKQNRLKGKR